MDDEDLIPEIKNFIEKIERYAKESYIVILKEGSRVNVSKSRIKELKTRLGI